jgi:hypothetical protein
MGLGWFRSFWAGLREVALLRDAERIACSFAPEQRATVREQRRRARAYLRAARRVASPDVALSMLDVALPAALASAHAAHASVGAPFDEQAELASLAQKKVLPESAARALEDRERASEREFAAKEELRERIDDIVTRVLASVEHRTPLEVRALRYGRVAALVLVAALCAEHVARTRWLVHDVALHKPVMHTALKVVPPEAEGVVDGTTRGTFGIHTMSDAHAFVTVDLQRAYDIREVRVYNRGDGWFDDILPLTLSVSTDNATFHEVATRTTHFDVWSVDLRGMSARYVRVSNTSYIALNEIEVYARE